MAKPPDPLPAAVMALAEQQHSAITRRQLRSHGVSTGTAARRVKAGVLRPLLHGAMAVTELADGLELLAAVQLLVPEVVIERRTAAAVWGLDRFKDRHPKSPDLAIAPKIVVRRAVPALRPAVIPAKAITTHRGLRITTPAWTLGQLGCCPDVSGDDIELALESALRLNITTEEKLRRVVAAEAGRGSEDLDRVLARRRPGDPPTESYAETRFLQRVVRPLGLEDPARQVPIDVGWRLPARADFLFRRGLELDVEVDGATHLSDEAREHDGLRDHRVRQTGRLVTRFAARRIEHAAAAVAKELLAELDAAG